MARSSGHAGPRPQPSLAPLFLLTFVLTALLITSMTACSPDVERSTLPADSLQAPAPTAELAAQQPTPAPTPASTTPPASSPTSAPTAQATPGAVGRPAATRTTSNPAARVYQQNGPSVVNITSVAIVRSGLRVAEQPRGSGSGFVWDEDGHIITNNHVIEEADQLTVTFQNRTTVPARLVGRDPDNDLAVIGVDPNAVDQDGRSIRDLLKPARLGDSGLIIVGEDAIAIGAPLGLEQTVTSGIVSALRSPGEEVSRGQLDLLGGAVQTDTAINPGNSGGPLFNADGEVIGVNTAILSGTGGNIGIGFAIPINVVKRVAPELIQRGCYRHPLIGVTTIPLSLFGQSAKQQLGLPQNQKGLLVQESSAGAAAAGIRAGSRVVNLGGEQVRVGGDIIVAIDGRPTAGGGELRAYIENEKRPNDTVTLTVLRNGQRQDVRVTLSARTAPDTCR